MATITNIINQRKKKKSKLHASKEKSPKIDMIKLNKIPSELIGEISSFLRLRDHINFERISRQIYISCNNPSRLVTLFLYRGQPYSNIRNKYPLIKHLLSYAKDLAVYMKKHPNNNHFKHLKYLHLRIRKETHAYEFVTNNNLINLTNITTFSCDRNNANNANNSNATKINIFKLLVNFPNIQTLLTHNIRFMEDINDNMLSTLLPKLRALYSKNSTDSVINKIINLYSHKLEALQVCQKSLQINTQTGFGKLTHLRIVFPSINTIDNILNAAHNLQQIEISGTRNLTDKELEHGTIKLIKTQKALQYAGFQIVSDHWNTTANIITNSLSQIKNIKKKEFRMRYEINRIQQNNMDMKKIKSLIENTVHAIHKLVSNDFMFIIQFDAIKGEIITIDDEKTKNEMVENMNDRFVCFHNDKKSYQQFIITNKDCKICGYKERWIKPDI